MIRLCIYAALMTFFADMLRRAVKVHADSLLLPIAAVVLVFLFLVIKHTRKQWRRLRRATTRKNTAFIRPRVPRWEDTH